MCPINKNSTINELKSAEEAQGPSFKCRLRAPVGGTLVLGLHTQSTRYTISVRHTLFSNHAILPKEITAKMLMLM